MPKNITTPGHTPKLTKLHKLSIAGVATLGAAALAFSLVPGNSQTTTDDAAVSAAKVAYSEQQIKDVKASVTDQLAGADLKAQAIAAKKKAAADATAAAKKKAADAAAAKKKAAAQAAAKKKAAASRAKAAAASRSTQRINIETVAAKTYANNLDGWIRESLDIMKSKGIPGTYQGLHKNIMRESSGNPLAINDWDINAINGIPSKGLLQVIPPTFKAYHVAGTSWNIYDPVANITAACNYAADKYGSMDNVNSAY
ncbi:MULTISPECIES: transglycosylase SLT domain-containing protein [unclassified Streptomyces]|uniref:transglycosylase SLT domain-containing protein n=1 Tax=unclassified Streptomyces TaxID=2593676 RepID=UPI002254CF5D|nr:MULTISPECIES: transglycosylase SLT domain-containing protein [unclassified Streptomyces]MCX4991889.1 transglycosylase SLT domain-containing protein [Streptomyces sp. NBC_00568]MCX5002875.1 transglycosylase SLT domain-containing protein [Streptomyces sp. NBC_00638]